MRTIPPIAAAVFALAATAHADIYQWEYINPADPSQGKRQGTTLAPGGAGVDAAPGADFSSRDLTMAYLTGADVRNSTFYHATLTDADFNGANVQGALFDAGTCIAALGCFRSGTGITPTQLYSTASYQAQNLRGIGLRLNNLAGGNFAGQNLTDADLVRATLSDADFRGANLTNARFATLVCHDLSETVVCAPANRATLTNAELTAADARGAQYLDIPLNANITNLILPNGEIDGLDLDADGLLVVRDYDGNPLHEHAMPIPIAIDQHLTMGLSGTLRLVFEADAWDSTISFAPGIPVTRNGTLEFTFAADVNVATQVGRTLRIFDWTGVTPTGAFAVSSPYRWDTSNLYTSGEVTLLAVPEPSAFLVLGILVGCLLPVCRVPLSVNRV